MEVINVCSGGAKVVRMSKCPYVEIFGHETSFFVS